MKRTVLVLFLLLVLVGSAQAFEVMSHDEFQDYSFDSFSKVHNYTVALSGQVNTLFGFYIRQDLEEFQKTKVFVCLIFVYILLTTRDLAILISLTAAISAITFILHKRKKKKWDEEFEKRSPLLK